MKIDKFLWSRILFHYKDLIDEGEISIPICNIVKVADLTDYSYLDNEYPYSDTIWEISEKLSEIDLSHHLDLENLFFDNWKNLKQEDKQYKFAQNEYKIFTKEFKNYFVDRVIKNPSFEDLYFFKKNISQENLRIGLNNFFDNCIFNNFKNQSEGKIDYWENVDKNKKERFTSKDRSNLIDLLFLADLSVNDLNKFNKIGFLNRVLQVKFDKLLNKEVKENLIEIKEQEVYLIDIKINALSLLNDDNNNLNTKNINSLNEKINALFTETIQLEKINKNNNEIIKFLAFDQETFKESSIKANAISEWIYKNKIEFINYVNVIEKEFNSSITFSWKEKIKELGEKIILENKLEKKLIHNHVKQNSKKNKI